MMLIEAKLAMIVSCDIVGHGLEPVHALQVERICGLNAAVRTAFDDGGPGTLVWASGGDGGHAAFVDIDGLPRSLALMQRLRDWASVSGVKLRLTAHAGVVSTVEGADGRIQLVGDGINLSGSLVNFGVPGRIIVTSDFRRLVVEANRQSIRFADERVVYLKHFQARVLCQMVFNGDAEPLWELERSDPRLLREALRVGNRWHAIYHIKRLLQVDSEDPLAREALDDLDPETLTDGGTARQHPLLASLTGPSLRQLLRASELVEREDGDVICHDNDSGDSMFIVLRGQVGVVVRPVGESDQRPRDIRIGEGGIAGELALALSRPRTATMQSIGPTALLALDYDKLEKLLYQFGPDSRLATNFMHFLNDRIVEHLFNRCRYLDVMSLPGPAGAQDGTKPRPRPWAPLLDGATRIVVEANHATRLYFDSPEFAASGLYVLAGGNLIEQSENDAVPKRLSGERFDLLFVKLPGSLVSSRQDYKPDFGQPGTRITVIRLSAASLVEYARSRQPEFIARLRRRLGEQMIFDAFVSYTIDNVDLATRWREALHAAGLAVYMSAASTMSRFEPEIDLALAESLVLLPIISGASLRSAWMQREIAKRKTIFDERHANILPIETEPRLAEQMAVGFAPIGAGRPGTREEELAIERVIATIQEVKAGIRPPPYATVFPPKV